MIQFPEFEYRQNTLFVEDVAIPELAFQYGTPCYIYSQAALYAQWNALRDAFSDISFLPCYSVKANSNIAILQLLAQWGSGFDIVSVGELDRVLLAGGAPEKIMFSGVVKREDELRKAIHSRIGCINIESKYELEKIVEIASEMQIPAKISLRINPDVDAKTHPYIATGLKESKFGIDIDQALPLYLSLKDNPWVVPVGIDCHIGSQITNTQPYKEAAVHVFEFIKDLEQAGIELQHVDLGGGFGIRYDQEQAPKFSAFADVITPLFSEKGYQLILEPGRSIIGNAGVLITTIEYIKETSVTSFAMVDAAMNDLIRPALYDAWHALLPVNRNDERVIKEYDVVGPVCESGDFFARKRSLNELRRGELLAIMSAGAYAMTMASNYNSRQRPCELLINGEDIQLIRRRDALEELWANEVALPTT